MLRKFCFFSYNNCKWKIGRNSYSDKAFIISILHHQLGYTKNGDDEAENFCKKVLLSFLLLSFNIYELNLVYNIIVFWYKNAWTSPGFKKHLYATMFWLLIKKLNLLFLNFTFDEGFLFSSFFIHEFPKDFMTTLFPGTTHVLLTSFLSVLLCILPWICYVACITLLLIQLWNGI